MLDVPLQTDDQRLCELLDVYLAAVQSGDDRARLRLLALHPELAPWTDSLEALDLLAVASVGNGSPTRSAPPAETPLPETCPLPGSGAKNASAAAMLPLAPREGAGVTGEFAAPLFGHFELLEQAGRGGMGVVFKARQIDLDRTVALKMILSSRLASPEEVRRFQQEAKAAARLRHPNIVGIHEVGQINGQHYFTMDYIGGRSLARLLEAGPLVPDQAAQCLLSVARAVEFLHAQGIVHRDLKPANILLDERGQPFVSDFGLARVFSNDTARTETGAILGTPSYMAPEQARGESAAISPRTDVYSLGAVLYEMLTGRPPFREENQLNTLMQVLEGEPTLPNRLNRGVPPELQRICMCCLEKSPTERYESAAALADDLERYLRREPLSVRPVGVRQYLRRWSRRQPALMAHGAGLVLTGLVVQVRFMLGVVDLKLHLQVMGILSLWLLLSALFQRLLLGRAAMIARYAWATTDVVLLTAVLYISGTPLGPLLIGYPLVVTASGLWFHVRLVTFTTVLSLVSYAALMWARPEELHAQPVHYPLIFAAVLLVLGYVVGYQIHRLRVLSRYFEQQRIT